MDHNKIATECMKSKNPQVTGWHNLSRACAKTAANGDLDAHSRRIYRFEEAKYLLMAVAAHDPMLSTTDMLVVASQIAERANADVSKPS